MTVQEEKKNKRTGMIVSIGFHATLLILFFFLLAWREPNPPLPKYGIELNFGMVNTGSGNEQPQQPPNESESTEDARPEESPATQEATEPIPEAEEITPVEEVPEVTEAAPEAEPEPVEEVTATQPTESPVVKKEPAKVEEITEEPVTKPVIKPEPVEEPKKAESNPQPTEQPAENETDTNGADGNEGESDAAKASNQGNDANKAGDKGNPEGELDARALYGTPGGGGGASLNMAGWVWDFKPDPDDNSDETGKIVFEIKIDDQGEIISVRTLQKTVNVAVENIYKREVERLTFSKTSDNRIPAPISTGTITFIIKAK